MRVFFGLGLQPEEKLAVDNWRQHHVYADGRAVPAANFHITLAFVGEIADRQLELLLAGADEVLARQAPWETRLHLDRVGYWPKPGIFWIGPGDWTRGMSALSISLGTLAQQFGARKDKASFQPHVTLYRRCTEPPPAPSQPPALWIDPPHVTLFESRQGRDGVSYQALAEWD